MTEKEMKEAQERADMIVGKVKGLVALENRVIEARGAVRQHTLSGGNGSETEQKEVLAKLEAELKTSVEELDGITDELKWTTPCFRAYVLPQMSELVGTLKACDAKERSELAELVTALTDEANSQSPEALEGAIIARLKNNLERTFSA